MRGGSNKIATSPTTHSRVRGTGQALVDMGQNLICAFRPASRPPKLASPFAALRQARTWGAGT